MKDRVREAVFNLLGPGVVGKLAVDLFAGTGALGLEALSRGAARAIFLERHFPTARIIEQNIDTLGVADRSQVMPTDTFAWARNRPPLSADPWLIFCSPPYDFYVDRREAVLDLLSSLHGAAPPDSLLVVESDGRFDFAALPTPDQWDIRPYPPAVIGILHKQPQPGT